MRTLRRLLRRLSRTATNGYDDARLREELEAHLQMQIAENERAGLAPPEARRQAVLKLGHVEPIRSRYHDEQGLPFLDAILQDVRYAFRQLRKTPLFALTATLSLALGIGANAAVFTIVERVLLRSLPVPRPHELVQLTDERILTQPAPRFSYPFYRVLRDNDVLKGLAARFALGLNVNVDGQVIRADGDLVSGNYFELLGVEAQAGRVLSPADDRVPGAHPVAVISDRFWRRTLAADPSAVGRQVLVNDRPFSIVGVAAKGFAGTDVDGATEVWIPLAMQREAGRDLLTDSRTNWLELIGRVRPDVGRDTAAAALTQYLRQRAAELPTQAAMRSLVLLPGDKGSSALRRELGSALLVLGALTVLALALACVNVACLSAVRSAARENEIAIRLALGAGRARLTQQLLTEAMLLAGLGGAAGVMIAPWLARSLAAFPTGRLAIDAALDARLLTYVLLVSLLAGVAIAVVPILASRRIRSAPTDRSWTSGGARPRRVTAHDAIVTVQIAMALAMLISAALLVQNLRTLKSIDPGFRADNLLLVSLDAATAGYDASRIDGFWRAVLEQVGGIPDVESASLAGTVPLAPGRQRQPWVNPASGGTLELDTNFAGPAYFATLGIPLVAGRDFEVGDGRSSQPVVIVNERAAGVFWPGQDPIGKGIRLPDSGKPLARVVGVVRDAKYRDLRADASPMIYRPVLQTRSTDAMTLHVRGRGETEAVVSAIRLAVQRINRNVPLFRITTLEDQLDAAFAQTRQAAMLTGAFGTLALVLSAVGVYGVTALAVSRRTRDIGIRIALGARRIDIARTIGLRALALVAAGVITGVLASMVVTRIAGSLLFEASAGDAATFASMAGLLTIVCALAFAIPVRTALGLDALAAIRRE